MKIAIPVRAHGSKCGWCHLKRALHRSGDLFDLEIIGWFCGGFAEELPDDNRLPECIAATIKEEK